MIESKDVSRLDVINRIKGWIDSGDLPAGGPLPTERELSERLDTQRLTIRGALAVLEQEGVVRRIGLRTRVVADRVRMMEHSIVVINTSKQQWLTDRMHMPGWAVMMSVGALAEVSNSGFNLLLIHPERITDAELHRLVAGRPSGVVFPELLSEFPDKKLWLEKLTSAGIPVTVFGSAPELASYDRVRSDHEAGSYKLTRHMLSLGARRPLMFYSVGPQSHWLSERRAGYERAMREAGLQPLPMVRFPSTPVAAAAGTAEQFDSARRHAVSYLMDFVGPIAAGQKVDALLTATDGDLYAASAACRTLGAKPGEDILLAGYDNYWVECWERQYEQLVPVASIDKCNAEAGRQMVQLTCERAGGKLPPMPHVRTIEPQLVINTKGNGGGSLTGACQKD